MDAIDFAHVSLTMDELRLGQGIHEMRKLKYVVSFTQKIAEFDPIIQNY